MTDAPFRLGPGRRPCPQCGAVAECDLVDIGVGLMERGNWRCEDCGWAEEPVDLGLLTDEPEGEA